MIALVVAAVAMVLAGVRAAQVMKATRVNAHELARQLAKLCSARNVDRAVKLCEAGGEMLACETMGGGMRELQRVGTADAADAGFEGRRVEWAGTLARGRWMAMAAIAVVLAAGAVAAVAPDAGGVVGRGRSGLGIALGVAALAGLMAVWSVFAERKALAAVAAAWRNDVMPALRGG